MLTELRIRNFAIIESLTLPLAATENSENGSRVTVTIRNTMVSATSRIVSAISFGVFWRSAPSTSAIMRSRKVSPSVAMCTSCGQLRPSEKAPSSRWARYSPRLSSPSKATPREIGPS